MRGKVLCLLRNAIFMSPFSIKLKALGHLHVDDQNARKCSDWTVRTLLAIQRGSQNRLNPSRHSNFPGRLQIGGSSRGLRTSATSNSDTPDLPQNPLLPTVEPFTHSHRLTRSLHTSIHAGAPLEKPTPTLKTGQLDAPKTYPRPPPPKATGHRDGKED